MNRNQLISLLLLLTLLCLLVLPVSAAQTLDLTRTGSIRLTMRYDGKAVGGGELTLYQVAVVRAASDGYVFVPVAGMEGFAFTAQELEEADLATRVLAQAQENRLSGRAAQIGSDGVVRFDGLAMGLYLIEQTVSAPGFSRVRPFLVSLPLEEDGTLLYDVDASPKPEPLTPEGTEPSEPSEPTSPTTPTRPSAPANPTTPVTPSTVLPQTGQLNWPIPVLLALGCICLLAGLLLLRKERD